MKKIRFFAFIIVIIGIIYIIPITSVGDVNKNSEQTFLEANINIDNKPNLYNNVNNDESEDSEPVVEDKKEEPKKENNTIKKILKNSKKQALNKEQVKNQVEVKQEKLHQKLIFEYKQLEKHDKPLVYKIKYPIFNNKNIEQKVNSHISELANDFKNEFSQYEPVIAEEKFIFNLDTDMYILNDSLLFIKFNVERNYNTYPNPVKFFETYILDIKKEQFVNIENILNKDYEDLFYLSAKNYFLNNYGINITKQSENYNDIKPDKEVYRKLFIKSDFAEIFFYDYKKQEEISIKMPVENILGYMNKEYLETTTIITTEATTESTTVTETTTKETTTVQQTTKVTETQQTTEKETVTEETTSNNSNINNKRKIDKNKPMIALTFDDGPNSATTNKILDILEKNNSVATFFVVSRRIEKDIETLKRMDSLGNQIGNHTANHKDLTKISKEQIKSEVDIVNNKLKKAIGKEASIVRVPYGATNDNVKSAINYPIIMWNVDTRDWKSRNAKSVEQQVIGKVKDGDIILMHDLYESTAQACETIIPKLIEQGYQFVTIDELFEYKGIEMKNGTKYSNANKK